MARAWAVLALLAAVMSCDDDPVSEAPDAQADAWTDGSDTLEEMDTPELPPLLDDGEACTTDAECQSGRCMTEAEGFPDGHCTTFDCEVREDCQGVGRACLRGEFNGNLCVVLCGSDDDCRSGYECRSVGSAGYCYPAFASNTLDPRCDSELVAENDVVTSYFPRMDRHRLTFDVTDEATSFAVVLYNRHDQVLPERLVAPSEETLDLLDEYGFFMTTGLYLELYLEQHIWPLMIPAGPDWTEWIQPGEYTLDVGTTGSEVCYFVLENHGLGTVIDLNFYFVGVRGLNARSADEDPDFQSMLASFEETMEQAEVEVGRVRYFDVTGDIEDAFAVIRTEDEVFELMTLSRAPGQALEDLLSVNVFFVRDFAGEMFSVLGVAPGIPGVMGIHGQEGTGLIFSASNLGTDDGDRLVGQVLAHELGHFLGLAHTTDRDFNRDIVFDWLADTPECPDMGRENLQSCPDFENLMFPFASFRDRVVLSEGQILVLRSDPQVRPE